MKKDETDTAPSSPTKRKGTRGPVQIGHGEGMPGKPETHASGGPGFQKGGGPPKPRSPEKGRTVSPTHAPVQYAGKHQGLMKKMHGE